MKRFLQVLGLLFLVLAIIVIARTLVAPSRQIDRIAHTAEGIDAQRAARDLAGLIPFRTISYEGGGTEEQRRETQQAFEGLHAYMRETFTGVYETLEIEHVGAHNLLFVWKGADPSLKPILLVAHQDVVPIETGTEGKWTHPPFSGAIADGFIWGRGTLDDKGSVAGILEAVNTLMAKGFQPKRTIYLAFGQDEEIGGSEGAEKVADLLKTRGKEFEFVLDEGYGIVSKNMVPGVSAPVAIIGTSEKGYLSLELTVDSPGGHSSMPRRESSIGILSAAVQAVERHPMPAHLDGPVGQFFEYLEGNTSLPMRVAFRNMWLFGPVVQRTLEASPGSNAILRTTTAVTIFQAGIKDNVSEHWRRSILRPQWRRMYPLVPRMPGTTRFFQKTSIDSYL